ncbi:ABC transporter permease subunit [Kibdelosporangium philippinense]|uniref:ABC transporter permease subunit n=1 Tax=Kibdelosporangium philippinense TaxID=211113 RepID=A0ABS8ZEE2_9PSEU|nr:ABC transporter permease subunit [Kibdelosporangium philippinense]MCE7006140.1 ABC transporter permease subunit [Kibdelosporangium philippinense]
MKQLITAEYRKIFSVQLWWALLIPAAAISLLFTWGGALLDNIGLFGRATGENSLFALPAFAQGINLASVFGLILGATAVTGEMRHKTITTSYLTGPTRGAVLAAKLFTYSTIGAVYGVVCMLAATLGALLGDNFPDGAGWFTLASAGVVAMIMWTLLGVGVGALIGNQVGAVVGVLVYVLVVEPIIGVVLRTNDAPEIPPYLLNTAGSNMTLHLAFELFLADVPARARRFDPNLDEVRSILGMTYAPPWWGSGLIFVVYALALGMAGWLVARRRDIT